MKTIGAYDDVKKILDNFNGGVRAVKVHTRDSQFHEGLIDSISNFNSSKSTSYKIFYYDKLLNSSDDLYDFFKVFTHNLFLFNDNISIKIYRLFRRPLAALLVTYPLLNATTGNVWFHLLVILGIFIYSLVELNRNENPYFKSLPNKELFDSQSLPELLIKGSNSFPFKWFQKKNKYLIIINNLNWFFGKANSSLLKLLSSYDNLFYIFIEDEDIPNDNDTFFQLLKEANIPINYEFLPNLQQNLLLSEVYSITDGDLGFINTLKNQLKAIGDNHYQLLNVRNNIIALYKAYGENKDSFSIAPIISKQTIEYTSLDDLKVSKIMELILKDRPAIPSDGNMFLPVVYISAIYSHHFFNDGLHISTLKSIFKHKHDPEDVTDEFIENIVNDFIRSFRNVSGFLDYDNASCKFVIKDRENLKVEWVVNFIFAKLKLFSNSFPMYYEFAKKEDYAKAFLLNADFQIGELDISRSIESISRLLACLNDNADVVFFYLLTGYIFRQKNTPNAIEFSNTCFSKAWEEYASESNYKNTVKTKVFLSDAIIDDFIDDNFYNSLYYLFGAKLYGAEYLKDFNPDDAYSSILEYLSTSKDRSLINKFAETRNNIDRLILRDMFNKQVKVNNLDLSGYPLLALLDMVSNQAPILLPSNDQRNSEFTAIVAINYDNIPAHNKDPNYLLQLIVAAIHNNFLYNGNELIWRDEIKSKKEVINSLMNLFNKYSSELKRLSCKERSYLEEVKLLFHKSVISCLHLLLEPDQELFFKLEEMLNGMNILISDNNTITGLFESIIHNYEISGHQFGKYEAIYWYIWFSSRNVLEADRGRISKYFNELQEIKNKKLKYLFRNDEIIYFGTILFNLLAPKESYFEIKNALSKKHFTTLTRFQFLSALHIICFNGCFLDREVLDRECITICKEILSKYNMNLTTSKEFSFNLSILRKLPLTNNDGTLNSEYTYYLNILNGLIAKNGRDEFYKSDLGLFFFQKLVYKTHENKTTYDELKVLDDEVNKLLKSDPFNYLQYLKFYIFNLYDKFVPFELKERQDELKESDLKLEQMNKKLSIIHMEKDMAFNLEGAEKAEEFDNRIKQLQDAFQSTDSNREVIQNEISLIERDSEYGRRFRVEQLETTLIEYIELTKNGNNSLIHPPKYIICTMSIFLGEYYSKWHIISSYKDFTRNIDEHYLRALNIYLELEEYIECMNLILKLKYKFLKDEKENMIRRLEKQVDSIISKHEGINYDVSDNKFKLICLIYDFMNKSMHDTSYYYEFHLNILDTKVKINDKGVNTEKDVPQKKLINMMIGFQLSLDKDEKAGKEKADILSLDIKNLLDYLVKEDSFKYLSLNIIDVLERLNENYYKTIVQEKVDKEKEYINKYLELSETLKNVKIKYNETVHRYSKEHFANN